MANHTVRLFPLSLKMVEDLGGFFEFFRNVLPKVSHLRAGQAPGRFNLGRKLDLRPSPSDTLVLFFVPNQQAAPPEEQRVIVHARLGGGVTGPHRDPDTLSDAGSVGYFLVEPGSIFWLPKALPRESLPWSRASDGHKTRKLNLREFVTWTIDSTDGELNAYLTAAGTRP